MVMAAAEQEGGRVPDLSRNDISRLQEICGLTADGLNLAGIRRILELQEETRQLRAELAALRERAAANGKPGRDPSSARHRPR